MQRFTMIHDGSNQGWQAAYLAFHLSARLGAPLLVLLVNSTLDKKVLIQRAAQVEVGAHAADVVIETRLMSETSVNSLINHAGAVDGVIVPHRFVTKQETAQRFLDALSCPLWIVSKDSEIREMALLVDDFAADARLINYTATLSHRIKQSLSGLVREGELDASPKKTTAINWLSIPDFSADMIMAALSRVDANLLFLPVSKLALVNELSMNCVICPPL